LKVVVEMIYGPWEGTYEGESSDTEEGFDSRNFLKNWGKLTNRFQVGRRLESISPAAMKLMLTGKPPDRGTRGHKYEVVSRDESDGTLRARLEYRGIVKNEGDK
jgi:hypothetical protein